VSQATTPAATQAASSLSRALPAHIAAALDGYPAAALIETCLVEAELHGPRLRFVADVVFSWATIISRDIDQIPVESSQAVSAIRQSMSRTRDALLRVKAMLDELGQADGAAPCHRSDMEPSTSHHDGASS
jgi:hypothetical protein